MYVVTGAAGFIGFHLARALLARGAAVVGVDDLNPYYDVGLKHARLRHLTDLSPTAFAFHLADVADAAAFAAAVGRYAGRVTHVLHLAGQPGLRHSLADPVGPVRANVLGQAVVLGWASDLPALRHLVYASSSSVYGTGSEPPFAEDARADGPTSAYAASKRGAELVAAAFASARGLPVTGVRPFTVYGPWGRPDMAYYEFTRRLLAGEPVRLHGGGRMRRDFTYVDDAVAGILGVLERPPGPGRHPVYNVGRGRSESTESLLRHLERLLGAVARVEFVPATAGEREVTEADIARLRTDTGFEPRVSLAEGLERFVAWYHGYHRGRP